MRKERSILFVYVSFVFFFLLSQFVFIFVRFLVCLCHFWNSFKLTNMLFDRRHYLFSSKHTHIFNCECAHQFRTAKRDYSMDKHIAVSHFHTLSLAIKSMIHLYFLWFNVYTAFNEIWSIFNCGRRRMSMCVCVCATARSMRYEAMCMSVNLSLLLENEINRKSCTNILFNHSLFARFIWLLRVYLFDFIKRGFSFVVVATFFSSVTSCSALFFWGFVWCYRVFVAYLREFNYFKCLYAHEFK